MVSRVKTVVFQGIEAMEIDVQVHLTSGLPEIPPYHQVGFIDGW